MVNEEQLALFRQGVAAWNVWQKENPAISAFAHWKEHDAYKTACNSLLHDLKADAAPRKR